MKPKELFGKIKDFFTGEGVSTPPPAKGGNSVQNKAEAITGTPKKISYGNSIRELRDNLIMSEYIAENASSELKNIKIIEQPDANSEISISSSREAFVGEELVISRSETVINAPEGFVRTCEIKGRCEICGRLSSKLDLCIVCRKWVCVCCRMQAFEGATVCPRDMAEMNRNRDTWKHGKEEKIL